VKKIETWECPECAFRGNREEARRHATEKGCEEFRVLTHTVDTDGRVLDRSTEKRPAAATEH
jgi:hypothetical protein